MSRQTTRSMIGILAIIVSGFPAAASDVFVAPRIAMQAGYENNRLEESGSGEGSPFWQASPGLDVTVLGLKTETSLLFDYRRTQYAKSDFEFKDDASAYAQWRFVGGRNEVGASLGGGLHQDKALPDDDYTFWLARPYFVHTLERLSAEVSLKGTFRQTFYDVSAYTPSTDRADRYMDVRPGVRLHLLHQVTVWAELYAEHNGSDAAEAEYSGFGGALGCELHPAARLTLGAWAGIGSRPYSQKVDGENRRDTPTPAGAWATYRLRPWLELFSSVDFEFCASTIDGNEYSWWQAGGGLKFVFEHEWGSR